MDLFLRLSSSEEYARKGTTGFFETPKPLATSTRLGFSSHCCTLITRIFKNFHWVRTFFCVRNALTRLMGVWTHYHILYPTISYPALIKSALKCESINALRKLKLY